MLSTQREFLGRKLSTIQKIILWIRIIQMAHSPNMLKTWRHKWSKENGVVIYFNVKAPRL